MRRETRRYRERRVSNTPLPTLIEAFATYNRAQAHSPRTVSWYTEGLEAFVRYLKDRGRGAVLADLTVDVAREWVVHLQTRPNLHDSQRRLSDPPPSRLWIHCYLSPPAGSSAAARVTIPTAAAA